MKLLTAHMHFITISCIKKNAVDILLQNILKYELKNILNLTFVK